MTSQTLSGLACVDVVNERGEAYALQNATGAAEPGVWLGYDRVGGAPIRVHLTQKTVAALLPYLQRFVETGNIAE